jgi:phosphate starvation-inducible membrane PsiE
MSFLQRMNVYQAFVPLSLGYECLAEGASVEHTAAISTLLRQWAIYVMAWSLFIAKGKTKLSNMRVLVAILIIGLLFNVFAHSGMNQDCYKSLAGTQWPVFLGWPVLAMIFAYIERHVDSRFSTMGESEPLNA